MDNVKNDRYYIQKIQNDLQFIVKYMDNVNPRCLPQRHILV